MKSLYVHSRVTRDYELAHWVLQGVCPRLCAGSTLICATDLTDWVTDITGFLILTTASAVASTRLLNATQLLKYVYTSNSPAIFTITDSTHLHWTFYIFVFVCVPVLSDWSIVVQNLPVITKFSNNSKRKKMKMNCASYNRIDCEQSLCSSPISLAICRTYESSGSESATMKSICMWTYQSFEWYFLFMQTK